MWHNSSTGNHRERKVIDSKIYQSHYNYYIDSKMYQHHYMQQMFFSNLLDGDFHGTCDVWLSYSCIVACPPLLDGCKATLYML